MMFDAPISMMPTCQIPLTICAGLEDTDIDSKVSGMFTYEVTRKDEYGVEIKIKSISLNAKKRVS